MIHVKRKEPDGPPAVFCAVCGEEIWPWEDAYLTDGGPVHAGRVCFRSELCGVETMLTCLDLYIVQAYNRNDVAEAMGLERVMNR